MLSRLTYILFILLSVQLCFAQSNIDSLKKAIPKATLDDKYKIYTQLVLAYLETDEPDAAYNYANEFLQLAEKQSYDKAKMDANKLMALYYQETGDSEKAIERYNTVLNYAKVQKDKLSEANAHYNIGLLLSEQGIYEKALSFLFKALPYYEQQNDKLATGDVLHSIGQNYNNYKKPEKGAEFLERALAMRKQGSDKIALAATYNSLAISYSDMKQHNKAADNYIQAHLICQELSYPVGIIVTANNIGFEYYTLKNNTKALEYYNIALDAVKKYDLQDRKGATLVNISYIAFDEGNYALAQQYQKESLEMALANKDGKLAQECYEALAKTEAQLNNYTQAYDYQSLSIQLKDSLYKIEELQQIEELQTKYKFEKKELEIEKLKEKQVADALRLEKNQQALYGSVAVIVLAVGFIGLYYNRSRLKQKANYLLEQRNSILVEKNEEIQRQSEIIHETNVKIMDSIRYAKRIQYAIIPDKSTLSIAFADAFAYLKPRDVVSGDFYWCGVKNNKKVLVVADCTGHGVPGAFMTIMGSAFINQIVFEDGVTNPADILTELDRKIKDTVQKQDAVKKIDDGMDISICIVDEAEQELAYAGAKRPLYLYRDGELNEIKGNKFPIGGNPKFYNKHFTNYIIKYQKNDMIYLFSDGYPDQFGEENGKKFMIKKFKRLLANIYDENVTKQKQILAQTLQEWQGNTKQTDDILVVGVRL